MKRVISGLVFLSLFMTGYHARVDYSGGDPWGSLLVSHALVTGHGFTLDDAPDFVAAKPSHVYTHGGHQYYFFPPGTSILASPVIAAAIPLGFDPRKRADDRKLQRFLASLIFAGCGWLAFRILARRVPVSWAVITTAAFLLGTGAIANTATALRSHGPVMLLGFGALYLLTGNEPIRRRNQIFAGLLLGFAVWCRPTAILGAFFLPWILMPRRSAVLRCWIAAGIAVLAIFPVFRFGYGQWLHPYYELGRVNGESTFFPALLGNLFSFSRGQLTTSPFLVPLILLALRWPRSTSARWRIAAGLSWWLMLLILVSRFPNWVAGHSFGNRFLLDALPGLVLVAGESLAVLRELPRPRIRMAGSALLCALATVAIWINTARGAYDPRSALWSQLVDIGAHPEMSWSWRDAQWRMDHAVFRRLEWQYKQPKLALVPIGETILPTSDRVFFVDFHRPESTPNGQTWRWSQGGCASAIWRPDPAHTTNSDLTLDLTLGAFRKQSVEILVNGHRLGRVRLEGFAPRNFQLAVPRAALDAELDGLPPGLCVLELRPNHPSSRWVNRGEIGVALHAATLEAGQS